MRRSSPRRGSLKRRNGERTRAQVEPLAALVAVFALCVGLSTYATVLHAAAGTTAERDLAGPTLSRVHDDLTTRGVATPDSLPRVGELAPVDHRLNVTLAVDDRAWHAGPPTPARTQRAERRVGVRVGPGRVRPARLSVEVWR